MIRRARVEDADALAELHRASIRALCREHYSHEQLAAWTAGLTTDLYPKLMSQADVFVSEHGGQLAGLGVCDRSDALINAVYVHPTATGRRVGSTLMAELEALLLGRGAAAVHLNATLNAVGFYERLGYARIGVATNRLPSGIELPCVLMSKRSTH